MSRACSTNGDEDERIWDIGGKARRKEITRKTNRWLDSIRMDFTELGWDGMDWIDLT
jgi:hypothetical protein